MNKQEFETLINHGLVTDVQYADYMLNTSGAMSEIDVTKLAEMGVLSQPQVNETIIEHGIGVLDPSILLIDTEEELIKSLTEGGLVVLDADINISDALIIEKDTILDLNGKKLINDNIVNGQSVGLKVRSGNVVIKGEGLIKTTAKTKDDFSIAVWAQGGNVKIMGGTFENAGDSTELVYASNGGNVEIHGGEFKAAGPADINDGNGTLNRYTALNVKDADYKSGASKIYCYGGKFYNFNPMNNESEGKNTNFVAEKYTVNVNGVEDKKPYDMKMGEIIYEVVKNVIDTEEELVEAIAKEGKVTLGGDIVLSNYIEIRDKEVTINLNGHKITHPASSQASYKDVFEVYGTGKLVIEGKGQLIAEDGYCIYATGDSNVELNDGHYFSVVSAVDARKNAIVTINGGEFKVEGVNNPDGDYGQKYTLNLRDKTGNYASELANFIVKGGKFFKFDPSASEAEPTVTNFVAEGYKSVADGDWFKVVKA